MSIINNIDLSTLNNEGLEYKRLSSGMYIISNTDVIFEILKKYHSYEDSEFNLLVDNEDTLDDLNIPDDIQYPAILNISNVGPFQTYYLIKVLGFNELYKNIRGFL